MRSYSLLFSFFGICSCMRHSLARDDPDGLFWKDLSVVASSSNGTKILHPISGNVRNGRFLAILGPSGAGKSSFLTAVAHLSSEHVISGSAWIHHGKSYSIQPDQVAWLQQKDSFFTMLTVFETLDLASFLELPGMSTKERHALIESHLEGLGLVDKANRQIGDPVFSTNRLSGGERRRLSVALELLTEKHLLIADEPTTGLDSSMSYKVVKLLKEIAVQRSIPFVCVLHQPRSSIWNELVDDVMLMAHGGRVAFLGTADGALEYFASLGYECPEHTNPADFLVDLVSIDTDDAEQQARDNQRVDNLVSVFAQRQSKNAIPLHNGLQRWRSQSLQFAPMGVVRRIRRFGAILLRSWRQNIRNRSLNAVRLIASALNAVLLAQIFPTVRGGQPTTNSIADRVALLTYGAINMCFMAFMKTVKLVADEKPVLRREQLRRQYTALEYLLAKVLSEWPLDASYAVVFTSLLKRLTGVRIAWAPLTGAFSLLTVAGAALGLVFGSLTPSEDLATSASIPFLVILMVVGVINPSGVDTSKPPPLVIQLLRRMSPFYYAIHALCVGEYDGMEFPRQGLPKFGAMSLVRNGSQVLEALGLRDSTFRGAMISLGGLTASYLALSWLGLVWQFQTQRREVKDGSTRRKEKARIESIPIRAKL